MSMRLAFRFDVGWDFRFIIARVTGAPVHVALIIGERAYEADLSGVRCVPAFDLLKNGGDWGEITLPAWFDDALAERFMTAQLGKQYDWWGAIAAWWLGKPAENGARDKWFCSELVAAAMHVAGDNLPVKRYAYWTPRRVYNRWKFYGVLRGDRVVFE